MSSMSRAPMLEEAPILEEVTQAFRKGLPDGFKVDRSAVERHGSWEWMATRR